MFSNYNRRQDDRRLIIFGCLPLHVLHIPDDAAVLRNAHRVQKMPGWADKWMTYSSDEYGNEYTGCPGRVKPPVVIDIRKRTERGFD